MAKAKSRLAWGRDNIPLITLIVLLVATLLMGGGSRDDILSLVILRPLGVVCLGIGLATMTAQAWQAHRSPLIVMGAILALIVIHLIPLPPAIWMALPGRELAVQAGEAVGGGQPWRPIALVPYRTWNALYAMMLPAGAMVLASQLKSEQLRLTLYVIAGFAILSSTWGVIQTVSGYNDSFYFFRISSEGSANGLFANRNHHAAMLALAIPTVGLIATRIKSTNRTVILAAAGGMCVFFFFMILATGSRGGVVFGLIAIGLTYFIWQARPDRKVVPRRGKKKNYLPLLGVIGLVIAIVILAFLLSRGEGLDRLFAGEEAEENRLLTWSTIFGFMWAYMPLGSGIGSFVEIFQVHEPRDMLGSSFWNHAHNDWLEWALEGGIPAIILMLAAIVAFARKVLRLIGRKAEGRLGAQMALLGAIYIFILGLWSVVDYPLRTPSLAIVASLAAVWLCRPLRGAEKGAT